MPNTALSAQPCTATPHHNTQPDKYRRHPRAQALTHLVVYASCNAAVIPGRVRGGALPEPAGAYKWMVPYLWTTCSPRSRWGPGRPGSSGRSGRWRTAAPARERRSTPTAQYSTACRGGEGERQVRRAVRVSGGDGVRVRHARKWIDQSHQDLLGPVHAQEALRTGCVA